MKKKRNRGVTLVELMVSIALLSIILALGYQVFAHLLGTYDRTQRKWLVERSVNRVVDQVTDAVSKAYSAKLTNTAENMASPGEKTYARIVSQDEKIYYVEQQATEAVVLGEVGVPMELSFSRVDREEGQTGSYDNALNITVRSRDEKQPYEMNAVVHLPNLQNGIQETETAEGYLALEYVHSSESSGINIGEQPEGCFIATAAYGDYDQSSVMLLRQFRDEVLLTNAPGQWFVETYYALSPPIAEVIALHPALRLLTRVLLLPLQGVAVALLHPAFAGVVSCGYIGCIAWRRRKKHCAQTPD